MKSTLWPLFGILRTSRSFGVEGDASSRGFAINLGFGFVPSAQERGRKPVISAQLTPLTRVHLYEPQTREWRAGFGLERAPALLQGRGRERAPLLSALSMERQLCAGNRDDLGNLQGAGMGHLGALAARLREQARRGTHITAVATDRDSTAASIARPPHRVLRRV